MSSATSSPALQRLVAEGTHHADTARRSHAFTFQLVVALIGFGLAPLVPGARHLFGVATASQALAMVSPGMMAACVSAALFRRGGSESRAYLATEIVESFLLYAATLAILFASRITWSVLWILPPFSAMFWANAKPFRSRVYLPIIALAHVSLAIACVLAGGPEATTAAALALAMGVVCAVIYEGLARRARLAVELEAERNVLRDRLAAARLDAERERVATMLHERVGAAVAALADELESPASERQARALLDVLDAARPSATETPCSLADLAVRVDERCRSLCVDASYEPALLGDGDAVVAGPAAHALVRVAQELVRNAVMHGAAQHVGVTLAHEAGITTLTVHNDGLGLTAEAFAAGTGGLENARQWLAEQGGRLARLDVPERGGTELRASVGAAVRDDAGTIAR